MDNQKIKNTEAMKKAREKYNKNNGLLAIRTKNSIIKMVDDYCSLKGISKKEFIEKAIPFYIDNH